MKTIEQEVDHAKRAAQSARFQAKMAELDDQVRMLQQRAGSMDREAKREYERMKRDAIDPSNVRMSGSRVWRPWRASSVSLRNWTVPWFVFSAGSTWEHRKALLTEYHDSLIRSRTRAVKIASDSMPSKLRTARHGCRRA